MSREGGSERSLVARARLGDGDALETLLARSRNRLQRIARRSMGDRMRAECDTSDVVQSAWLEALRSLDRFDGERSGAFQRWLEAVLVNKVRKRARRRGALRAPASGELRTTVDSPSREAVRAETLRGLRRALERLSPLESALIAARAEGVSSRRMAELLGTTEVNVRSLVHRARCALEQQLARESVEAPVIRRRS